MRTRSASTMSTCHTQILTDNSYVRRMKQLVEQKKTAAEAEE